MVEEDPNGDMVAEGEPAPSDSPEEAMLVDLGMQALPGLAYAYNGVEVGIIQVCIGSKVSFKAVCRTHPGGRCYCYIAAEPEYWAKFRALLVWLRQGTDSSQDAHQEVSVHLRESFGVRIRKKLRE